MEYPEWNGTANCQGLDTEHFFVPDGSGTYQDVKLLNRICNNCEIKQQCLDYALKHAVLGYWGNTTEHQRKLLRQKLNIIPIPLYLGYP